MPGQEKATSDYKYPSDAARTADINFIMETTGTENGAYLLDLSDSALRKAYEKSRRMLKVVRMTAIWVAWYMTHIRNLGICMAACIKVSQALRQSNTPRAAQFAGKDSVVLIKAWRIPQLSRIPY